MGPQAPALSEVGPAASAASSRRAARGAAGVSHLRPLGEKGRPPPPPPVTLPTKKRRGRGGRGGPSPALVRVAGGARAAPEAGWVCSCPPAFLGKEACRPEQPFRPAALPGLSQAPPGGSGRGLSQPRAGLACFCCPSRCPSLQCGHAGLPALPHRRQYIPSQPGAFPRALPRTRCSPSSSGPPGLASIESQPEPQLLQQVPPSPSVLEASLSVVSHLPSR